MIRIITILLITFSNIAISQHLPAGMNDWYLWTSDEQRLYVVEGGQGDTVLVLHGGWGAEHSYLVPAFKPLFEKYHFIFYDQRGSLRSPVPDSTLSIQRASQDLEEIRNELNLDDFKLVTHSMGSYIAYDYMLQYPNRISNLVLLSPVIPRGAPIDRKQKAASDKEFISFFRSNEDREIKEEGLNRKSLNNREKTYRWKIGFAAANLYNVERWRQMKGGQAFYNNDIAQPLLRQSKKTRFLSHYNALKASAISISVILGDHDLVDFGVKIWPQLIKNASNINLKIIPKSGHNSWIDQPQHFYNTMLNALEKRTQ